MVSVVACFVPVADGCEGGGEVDAKRGLGTDEGWVEFSQCVGENRDGVWVAEAGEGVAAPAGEVHGVERDVGAFVGCTAG